LDLDVGELCGRLADQGLTLLGGEQRLVLADRVVDDADDDPLEDLRGALDDVQVPVGDRVIAARADHSSVALGHQLGSP
jgi:hypothetical protein